jgi:FMN phosphatase YigB (HAD superfamily)
VTIKTIVFDIGGVLAHDVWEHLFLDANGIAEKYDLPKGEIEEIGSRIWHEFAYQPETPEQNWEALEKAYWARFIAEVQKNHPFDVSPEVLIQMTDAFVNPVEGMPTLLEKLQEKGIELGICSDNNEFWFRWQMDKLELHRFFSPSKAILSCRVGAGKSSPRYEMFHAVSDAIDSSNAECLFVDNRLDNIYRSLQCGITGIHFPTSSPLGAEYVEALLEKMGVL